MVLWSLRDVGWVRSGGVVCRKCVSQTCHPWGPPPACDGKRETCGLPTIHGNDGHEMCRSDREDTCDNKRAQVWTISLSETSHVDSRFIKTCAAITNTFGLERDSRPSLNKPLNNPEHFVQYRRLRRQGFRSLGSVRFLCLFCFEFGNHFSGLQKRVWLLSVSS